MRDSVLASTYFPVRTSVGDIYADNDIMSEYSKFMAYLGDYYQITPGWTTARTEWWNMLQRVGSGEAVDTPVARPSWRTPTLPQPLRHKPLFRTPLSERTSPFLEDPGEGGAFL